MWFGLVIKGKIKMAKKKIQQNLDCKSESHGEHLCYIVSQGFHLSDAEEYNAIVKDPKFKCRHADAQLRVRIICVSRLDCNISVG